LLYVYYHTWEQGEVKSCFTFSNHPLLLICDSSEVEWPESFINVLGRDTPSGASEEDQYQAALSYVAARSKQFEVQFHKSDGTELDPWEKASTLRKRTLWHCTKKEAVSCSFGATVP
jgi:hypothetical protein